MAVYKAPVDDMRFNLYEVFDLPGLWASMPATEEVTSDLVDAILDEGARIAENLLFPINRSGDEEGCSFDNGVVTTPKGFKEAYQTYAEGGWIGLVGNPEYGGQGMPKTLGILLEEMLFGSNCSFALYPILTAGFSMALNAHGSEELKELYLPKMYSGEWAGAMCLTEPGAGSDLGVITTKAEDNGDGSYKINGSKIFITGGEQDLTENIVHLVLAKLPGAPEGSRGISMFLVPKFKVDAQGNSGAANGVSCGSIEHKMGIKGSATCVINFDNAEGFLVGEINKGLAAMFTMMNYERLSMGQQGLGLSEVSYQSAAAYAKDRMQGRAASGPVNPQAKGDAIIVHPDVRRMLLTMRAFNEAGRAFSMYVGMQLDTAKFSDDETKAARADILGQLLTPICKAFMTDRGLDCTILGQQVFGGHGYVREWGMEQFVRDVRIAQIYEGTNGIQAMDLVGRKLAKDNGKGLGYLLEDIDAYLASVSADQRTAQLQEAVAWLKDASQFIIDGHKNDANLLGSVSCDYLELLGLVAFAFMWVRLANAAAGKSGELAEAKPYLADFYFAHLLPKAKVLAERIKTDTAAIMMMPEKLF